MLENCNKDPGLQTLTPTRCVQVSATLYVPRRTSQTSKPIHADTSRHGSSSQIKASTRNKPCASKSVEFKVQFCENCTCTLPKSRLAGVLGCWTWDRGLGLRVVNPSRSGSEDEDATPRHAESSKTQLAAAAINPNADVAEGCGDYGFRVRGLQALEFRSYGFSVYG